ncbi:MAG: hypothetical protein HUJ27_13540 [Rhodobacteraceae bacterium]|nr:hypothetical protein [Paracoccaceae bacterium]
MGRFFLVILILVVAYLGWREYDQPGSLRRMGEQVRASAPSATSASGTVIGGIKNAAGRVGQ